MSFVAAVEPDGLIVAQAQAEEEKTSKDRHIACHLEMNGKIVPFKDAELGTAGLDDETLTKLQMLPGGPSCHAH